MAVFHTHTGAVTWLQALIEKACACNASDIHIDPDENYSCVKFRVDGVLHDHEHIPLHLHHDGIGRLKILSQLRTDEHAMPQDGRFRMSMGDSRFVDIRISIVPSYFGESVVLRLLRDTSSAVSLADLGISLPDERKILNVLNRASGIILITGPTGSGKTTTLYTLLRTLNDRTRSIITLEDPIEYSIPGIRQIQTNHARGLTFASGLRSLVRQDPDVIMVGEIRDTETAQLAVHAALTGHLLLSTLHTPDAATAIPRLIDMGVEPYLIASTLGIVVSQRLVRKTSGGRTGIYEVLALNERITEAITSHNTSAQHIRKLGLQEGMHTMEHDGLEKAEQGITSIEEVIAALST